MNITVTWQQLLKLRTLSADDMNRLHELVARKGTLVISPADKAAYASLLASKLVKSKADKAWTAFDVDGVRPAPFVGNARVKKEPADFQKMARAFCKAYRSRFGESYGAFEAAEWAFISRMAREYTVSEFAQIAKAFCRELSRGKATLQELYKQRQRLFRKLRDAIEQGGEDAEDGGW